MKIGEKIKQLRNENDVTQDKLAEYLNISSQAISKWENNTACPDLSLIVPIANFFGISTDVLFGRDVDKQNEEIKELATEGVRLSNLGSITELNLHWRKAVAKYPKSFECLQGLAYSLLTLLYSDVFSKDEKDNYAEEAITICDRILEDCTQNQYRASAIQIAVMIYGNKKLSLYDEKKAEGFALQSTPMYCCSEILLQSAYSNNSEKLQTQRHFNNIQYLDLLTQNIYIDKYKNVDEEICALNTALTLWNTVIYDENYLFYHCRISQIYRNLAIKYAQINENAKAISALYSAKEQAEKYMSTPHGEQHYTSVYVCRATHDNSQSLKDYAESELDLVRDILKCQAFDTIRNSEEFVELEKSFC